MNVEQYNKIRWLKMKENNVYPNCNNELIDVNMLSKKGKDKIIKMATIQKIWDLLLLKGETKW